MKIINSNQKKSWNKPLIENGNSFLQSFEWGKFQEALGRKVFRLKNKDWQASVFAHHLPFNKSYLYCPYGPIISPESEREKKLEEFIENLKKINGDGVIFIRIEPEWKIENEEKIKVWEKKFKDLGFKKLSKDVQPSKTLILDLGLNEDELLAQMRPKWRYNVRLAQKKAVKVEKYQPPITISHLEIFYDLLNKTSERHNYKIFGKEYYQKELSLKTQDFSAELFFAYYQKKVVAANLVIFFGKKATYVHGGSLTEHKEVMAPHLLQWEQIREAKRRGCIEYDFWGIDEKKWPGITRFKKGFGGTQINYLGAYDYVISPFWYYLYRGTKSIRRIFNY